MEGKGDAWTWVGIDADSKLVLSWFVGDRSFISAREFMQDIAGRLSNRVQLTTDGYKAYLVDPQKLVSGTALWFRYLYLANSLRTLRAF